jgi:hypothetical protein
MIIQRRYDDVADLSDGIKSLEAMTLIRRAFFILCSLRQTSLHGKRSMDLSLRGYVSDVLEGLALIKRRKDLTPGLSPLRETKLPTRSHFWIY